MEELLTRVDAMPPRCDIVVKFGGSAITEKAKFETLAEQFLASAAADVASGGQRAVVMHGAGSFGHFQARQFGVSKGSSHPDFSWLGFASTRASVTKLNGHVVNALVDKGVSAVGLPSFPTMVTRGKGTVTEPTREAAERHVRAALEAGLTPVLHGDAVLDELQGCSILSGDTLMIVLAHALRPKLAVFLADVAGVYDQPPSEAGATLLARLLVGADGKLLRAASALRTEAAAHDVTGGLQTKLEAAAEIARRGIPVVIVQVGTPHAAAALRGEVPDVCTLITRADEEKPQGTDCSPSKRQRSG